MPPTVLGPGNVRTCAACGRRCVQDRTGAWRCPPCRNRVERGQQQRAKRARQDAATNAAARISNLRHRATQPEHFAFGDELTEDELRDLVAADGVDAVDFGDGPGNYALMARVGALALTPDQLLEADRLWSTGEARRILKRAGVSGHAFGAMVGTTGRAAYNWINAKALPVGAHREAAAAALLAEKAGNDHDDSIAVAHGLEPTRVGIAQVEKDHTEIWQTDEPWRHCAGCKQWRQTNQRLYS